MAAGRSQVVDPSAAQDIATKNYVDVTAGTALATASALMRVVTLPGAWLSLRPSAATDAANKAYVDGLVGGADQPDSACRQPRLHDDRGHRSPVADPGEHSWRSEVRAHGDRRLDDLRYWPTILGRLRCGTAGTIADAQLLSQRLRRLRCGCGWLARRGRLDRARHGASGVLYAEMELVGDNIADRIAVATANFTINTTVANFLSLCALAGGTTPAGNILMGYSWVIKP
jgi:hypothetical protein